MARSRPIDGLLAVAGQHHDVVGQRQHLGRRRLRSIVGWSPPGRSVRPIEPAKSRSPENITSETSSRRGYGERKVTEPSVWPGVWSTTNRRPASSSSWQVGQLADVVRLGALVVAAEQHLGGLGGHAGHRVGEQVPVAGWIQAVASYAPATGATHHMWSTWPWVTSTLTGLSRCSATTLGDAVGGVLAGVDDHALGAGSRRHDVAVGAPRTCGEAGDQHRPALSADEVTAAHRLGRARAHVIGFDYHGR